MQPQLTTRRHGVWWLVPTSLGGLMLLLLVWCHGVLAEAAPSALFPLPDVLRPNVTFWKRVFAVFDRNGGLLHDMEDVSIVYHIWYNDLPSDAPLRQEMIDEARIATAPSLKRWLTGNASTSRVMSNACGSCSRGGSTLWPSGLP